MAATKMTFTLDDPAIQALSDLAKSMRVSKSQAVRNALLGERRRLDRLTAGETSVMLEAIKRAARVLPSRTQQEVDLEIRELRSARKHGGRITPA